MLAAIRSRSFLGILVVGVVFVVFIALTPDVGEANWPWGSNCGMRDEAEWDWEPEVWVGAREPFLERAKDGFRNWQDQAEGWKGGIVLSYSGAKFNLRWDSLPGVAKTTCPLFTHNIEFALEWDAWLLTDQAAFEGVATHEWGHAFGFRHSGRYSSHDGNAPVMSTCWIPNPDQSGWAAASAARRFLSQDDSIAVQHLTNKSDDSQTGYDEYAAFTANPSFEESIDYWGKSSAIYHFNTHSGGVDGSARYGHVGNTSTNGYIYQTSRILTDRTDNDNTYVRVRVNVKKHSSSDVGTVKYRLRYRSIKYNAGADPACNFPEDKNIDLPDGDPNVDVGGWKWHTEYSCPPPSSGWDYCTSGRKTLDPDPEDEDADGWDLRIYVYPRMKPSASSPYWTTVRVDRTRVLVDDPGAQTP